MQHLFVKYSSMIKDGITQNSLIMILFVVINIVGIAHILVAKKNLFPFLNISIWERGFWKNKTIRWLLVMALGWLFIGSLFWVGFFGFFVWLFYILWELPNSYIKRKLLIKPWKYKQWWAFLLQYIFDIIDSVLAICLLLLVFYKFSLSSIIFVLIVWILNHILFDLITWKWKKYPNVFVIIMQILAYGVYKVWNMILWHNTSWIRLWVPRNIKKILIANHISYYDPFVILWSLTWSDFVDLLPVRIMVKPSILKWKYWWFLAYLFWWYSSAILDTNWKNTTLKKTKTFLDRGESVFLFPEGGIDDKHPWVGAWYLQRDMSALLILFSIQRKKNKYTVMYRWTRDVLPHKDLAICYDIDMQRVYSSVEKQIL